ncbi:hypothetical protein [Nocardioides sp. B-3]|uniref:hypothetical protein n=1 Tax=Nocardioides sp. B-3 TaxID=2895565 RepID=UPI002152E0F8|nr:hypothetical protein [Nocardioides sp. B-3]UUZ59297.1 hypothetical protein LP418_26150 [Nocardioides sp. B-3]
MSDPARFARQPRDITAHVMEKRVAALPDADARITPLLDRTVFTEIPAQVPDAWLEPVPGTETPDALRAAYVEFLTARLATRAWLPGAES